MIVEFVASFAAESLGMSAHPGAGGPPPQINLPLARQCIDMLGTLERKTRGNLNAEERHFFDLILTQLRMQYVSLSGAPRTPSAPASDMLRLALPDRPSRLNSLNVSSLTASCVVNHSPAEAQQAQKPEPASAARAGGSAGRAMSRGMTPPIICPAERTIGFR